MVTLKKIFAFTLSASLLLSSVPIQSVHAEGDEKVSVKLSNYLGNRTSFPLKIQGKYYVKEADGLPLSTSYALTKEGSGIRLKGDGVDEYFPKTLTLIPHEYGKDHLVYVNGRPYMGEMMFTIENGYIRPMNSLALEHYLKGVVPKEMPTSWNLEALKAQAVAARSYAEKNAGKVMVDTQTNQVYGGYEWVASTTKAVEETAGEILTYGGKVIDAVYASSNGGMIESNRGAWGGNPVGYLKAKVDPYDPQITFTYTAKQNSLVNILNGTSGVKVTSVDDVKIKTYTEGRYADTLAFTVNGGEKTVEMKFATLKSRLGATVMRSKYITSIQKSGNNFIFTGKGFGHGVGMSQYGAKVMAERGFSYKEILAFYYSGTTLKKGEKQETITSPTPVITPTEPVNQPTPTTQVPTVVEETVQKEQITEEVIKQIMEQVKQETPKPAVVEEKPKGVTYIVKKGDSLYLISQKYDLKIGDLKKWNGLKSNTIYVGQKLQLTKPEQSQTTTKTYTVQKGDTLYRVAKTYDVNIDQIKTWNTLKNNTIYVGQKLIVNK